MIIVGTFYGNAKTEWIEKTLKIIPKGKKLLDARAGEKQ